MLPSLGLSQCPIRQLKVNIMVTAQMKLGDSWFCAKKPQGLLLLQCIILSKELQSDWSIFVQFTSLSVLMKSVGP